MMRLLCLLLLLPGLALAQAPQKIGYQGRLLNSDGSIATGTVSFTFAIYDVATGGTALWSEDQSLALSDGFYATQLGGGAQTFAATNAFAASPRYFSVKVNNTELLPRQEIGSVPWALNATNVVGGTVNASSVTASSVTVSNGGSITVGGTSIVNNTTGKVDIAALPTGNSATTVALGSHTHAFAVSGAVSPTSPLVATHNFNSTNVVAAAYVSTDGGSSYTQVAQGNLRPLSLGSGKDGAITFTTNTTLDTVKTTCTGSAGNTSLTVGNITGFATGDVVMAIQMQGTGAGNWEEHTITAIGGAALTLDTPLANSYSGKAMALRVPQYTNVTVNANVTLTASAWDGTLGGVLAFKATGKVTNNGAIDVSAKGFRGGASNPTNEPYTIASGGPFAGESYNGPSIRSGITGSAAPNITAWPNGGGGAGGVNGNGEGMVGGGGGGYGTPGLLGVAANALSPTPVMAPPYGDEELTGAFLGSGGGGGGCGWNAVGVAQAAGYGEGGAGGGIIVIRAGSLDNRGWITSNGGVGKNGQMQSPATACASISGGGGGGGSGGTVLVEAATGSTGVLYASGGPGGSANGSCYNWWTGNPIGGMGGQGRVKTRVGSGYSLVLTSANTATLFSSIPVANAKVVVVP